MIAQDLQKSWLRIEEAHGLKVNDITWLSRQHDALDALLPVVFFAEAMRIDLHATDLVDIDRLAGLVGLLHEKYPAGALLACRRAARMMAQLPDHHSQAGKAQSACCQQHYAYAVLGARSLQNAAKASPSWA